MRCFFLLLLVALPLWAEPPLSRDSFAMAGKLNRGDFSLVQPKPAQPTPELPPYPSPPGEGWQWSPQERVWFRFGPPQPTAFTQPQFYFQPDCPGST